MLLLLIAGCEPKVPVKPGIGNPISWEELPGWSKDNQSEALQSLLEQCPRMEKKAEFWKQLCTSAAQMNVSDDAATRALFEKWFRPHEILGKNETKEGLITGYYQPILNGSRAPSDRYRYPLYSQPEDLLVIELSSLFPELKGKRVRGRLEGNKVVPYYDRAEIDTRNPPLKGRELVWIDDPYGSFFLQIQGSGRVKLEDGTLLGVNYANQNGHPYVSIGKKLVEMNEMQLEEVSLFTIREWLEKNPDRASELLEQNPSYVFFTLRKKVDENPRGSLNVPLTDMRSIAVDRKVIPLGTPVWLDTTLPDGQLFQRLMLAQDTGGAINGPVRADIYFGTGDTAEQLAGTMKQSGKLYAFLPKEM